jgi:soluble lytic murein transglycosylase
MNERTTTRALLALLLSLLLISVQRGTAVPQVPQETAASLSGTPGIPISPTAHPVVPERLEHMWFAPPKATTATAPLIDLAKGVRMLEQTGDAAAALPLVSNPALADTDVVLYARYYTGVALQRLNRLEEAEAAFAAVVSQEPSGHLGEAAPRGQADVREARGDYAGAAAIYEGLVQRKLAAPQAAWLKLGMMTEMIGQRDRAREAFGYVLETFPFTQEGAEAELGLERIDGFDLSAPGATSKEMARADAMFAARRWSSARSAYERVRSRVEGEDRDLVTIRLAAIEAQTGRARAARDTLQRYVSHPKHAEEAQFALLSATLAAGDTAQYRSLARAFAKTYPTSPRAEEALDTLAVHLIRADEDEQGAVVFREMVDRFPAGKLAERAAWRAGWWAYREDQYQDTVRIFERAAAAFPRSDYRPAWLYWSARAYDGLGDKNAATERYRLAATDYMNTYYGRLSWKRLQERNEASVRPGIRRAVVEPPPPPPNIDRVARLIELELYHPALAELQYAQKMYGDSAPLQATIALMHNRTGNLRLGINAMKRAYPQYMTAGGDTLPREILEVIFPLDYWPMIQAYAKEQDLDPYLIAALMGQESTFDASIVSVANAIGLMQVMPATGRQYARTLGIKPFSPARLTDAEINARIGTRYFGDLVRMFGATHYAIASYNAGENRVERWQQEKPGLEQDEFIDDIPYAETQNYVKRILGTAEDYRRLYGNGQQPTTVTRPEPRKYVAAASAQKTSSKASAKKATAKKTSAKKPTAKKPTAKKAAAGKSTAKTTKSTVAKAKQ